MLLSSSPKGWQPSRAYQQVSSSELSQIPGHPKIDIQSRDRKVCLPTQFNPRGVTCSPPTPLGGITAMGQQRAPLHRHVRIRLFSECVTKAGLLSASILASNICCRLHTAAESWPCHPFVRQSGPGTAWVSRGLVLPSG